jgi:hypothetical protein
MARVALATAFVRVFYAHQQRGWRSRIVRR